MDGDRIDSSSDSSDDKVHELDQETQGMNQILQMVSDMNIDNRPRDSMNMGGLQEELNRIEKEQEEVIQKLDQASRLIGDVNVPAAICAVLGTWKAEEQPSTSETFLPPAFDFKYLWYKLEGNQLHSCVFTGHNHVRNVEPIGVECNRCGVVKVTYVERNRLVTVFKEDQREGRRVEVNVDEYGLHYLYMDGPLRFYRNYKRAFKQEYQY